MCCMLFLRFGLQCMGAADWMGWCRPVGAWDALRVNIGVCFSRRWVFDGDVDRTRSGGGGGGGGDGRCIDMGLGLVLLEARVDSWVLGSWFGVVCPCVRLSWIGCLLVGSKGWLNAG